MLEEKIFSDYQKALKEKDNLRVSVLRFLRSQILNLKIEKRKELLEDSEVIAIIRKQIKNSTEAIEEYKKGNRQDLVEKESKELEILKTYLPSPLSEEEVLKIIEETIHKESASSLKDMGKVMKAVLEKIAGRFDSQKVSQLVREKLSSL
jgi:uncharacterized protein YqeY